MTDDELGTTGDSAEQPPAATAPSRATMILEAMVRFRIGLRSLIRAPRSRTRKPRRGGVWILRPLGRARCVNPERTPPTAGYLAGRSMRSTSPPPNEVPLFVT